MAKYTYIKHDIRDFYIEFDEMFDPNLYNNIGETWDDFLDNLWVLLSPEQVAFHKEYPYASIKEVWDMELTPISDRTIEQAKAEMINNINSYDASSNVNGFTVNNDIVGWFTPDERSNYRSSIDAAKLLGVETLSFYIGNMMLDVTPTEAEYMLAQIQLYADACYIVTKQHKIAVEAMETIEEVDAFAYMEGYPEKLNFNFDTNKARQINDVQDGE